MIVAELREWQKKLVDRILSAYSEGEKYVSVDAPTGSGKTLLSLAIADKMISEGLVKRAVIVVRTRNEVEPYDRDIRKFVRKRDYTFMIGKEALCPFADKEASEEDIDCTICKLGTRPDIVKEYITTHGFFKAVSKLKKEKNICPWHSLRERLTSSEIIVMTYPYVFSKQVYVAVRTWEILPNSLLVIDEAHNIDRMNDLYEVKLDRHVLAKAKYQVSKIERYDRLVARAMNNIIRTLGDVLNELLRGLKPDRLKQIDKSLIRRLFSGRDKLKVIEKASRSFIRYMISANRFTKNYIAHILLFAKLLNNRDYTLFANSSGFVLKPVDPSYALKPLDKPKHVLMMSGTMFSEEYLQKVFGIKSPIYKAIEYGSFNPYDNAKWIIAVDVTTRFFERKPSMWVKYAEYISAIARSSDASVLVITPSYDVLDSIRRYSNLKHAVFEDESISIDYVIDEVLRLRRVVIVGVARGKLSEGIEVTDSNGESLIRDVVIAGIPYPPPDDDYNKLRSKLISDKVGEAKMFDIMMFEPALVAVRQALGRAIRSPRDKARFWLLDERFTSNRWINRLGVQYYEKVTLESLKQAYL